MPVDFSLVGNVQDPPAARERGEGRRQARGDREGREKTDGEKEGQGLPPFQTVAVEGELFAKRFHLPPDFGQGLVV